MNGMLCGERVSLMSRSIQTIRPLSDNCKTFLLNDNHGAVVHLRFRRIKWLIKILHQNRRTYASNSLYRIRLQLGLAVISDEESSGDNVEHDFWDKLMKIARVTFGLLLKMANIREQQDGNVQGLGCRSILYSPKRRPEQNANNTVDLLDEIMGFAQAFEELISALWPNFTFWVESEDEEDEEDDQRDQRETHTAIQEIPGQWMRCFSEVQSLSRNWTSSSSTPPDTRISCLDDRRHKYKLTFPLKRFLEISKCSSYCGICKIMASLAKYDNGTFRGPSPDFIRDANCVTPKPRIRLN